MGNQKSFRAIGAEDWVEYRLSAPCVSGRRRRGWAKKRRPLGVRRVFEVILLGKVNKIDVKGWGENPVLLSNVDMSVTDLAADCNPYLYRRFQKQSFLQQDTLWRDGELFKFYKFRSMCVDVEEELETCYWQFQPDWDEKSFGEWMKLDVQYIQDRSFSIDWKIIFLTVNELLSEDMRESVQT